MEILRPRPPAHPRTHIHSRPLELLDTRETEREQPNTSGSVEYEFTHNTNGRFEALAAFSRGGAAHL